MAATINNLYETLSCSAFNRRDVTGTISFRYIICIYNFYEHKLEAADISIRRAKPALFLCSCSQAEPYRALSRSFLDLKFLRSRAFYLLRSHFRAPCFSRLHIYKYSNERMEPEQDRKDGTGRTRVPGQYCPERVTKTELLI
jgi:hypothetical protein